MDKVASELEIREAWTRVTEAMERFNAATESAYALGLRWFLDPVRGINGVLHVSETTRLKVNGCEYRYQLPDCASEKSP